MLYLEIADGREGTAETFLDDAEVGRDLVGVVILEESLFKGNT